MQHLSESARLVELRGLHLFEEPLDDDDVSTTYIITVLLAWLGASPLPELSLPLSNVFVLSEDFSTLRMPNLKQLNLSTGVDTYHNPRSTPRDLLCDVGLLSQTRPEHRADMAS